MSLKNSVFPALTAAASVALMATSAFAGLPAGHSADPALITRFLKSGDKPAAPSPDVIAAGATAASADIAIASADPATAASSAIDVVATTGTCEAYFTKSQSLTSALQTALPAMSSKNAAAQAAALPALEAQFNSLPNAEVRAEVCGGNHVNAYSSAQFTDLNVLLAHGYSTGFPANLPIVKQPELNQVTLAYAVGWIKYEQQNFNGALTAYGKGLTMFPQNHELQNEYLSTLLQLQNGQGTVDFADKILATTFDLDDATRAKVYAARGLGLVFLNRLTEANDSLTVSLRYNYTDDVAGIQKQVQAAMPK